MEQRSHVPLAQIVAERPATERVGMGGLAMQIFKNALTGRFGATHHLVPITTSVNIV